MTENILEESARSPRRAATGATDAENGRAGGEPADKSQRPAVRGGTASQWELIRRKFMRHKLARVGLVAVLIIYGLMIFAEVLAPVSSSYQDEQYGYAPPQRLHIHNPDDRPGIGLFVYGYTVEQDPETFARTFTVDPSEKIEIGILVKGEPYRMWGLIPGDRHLIGPVEQGAPLYLWGADPSGRDLFSRILYGARVSLSIGLVGVAVSFLIGVALGGVSGYYGGKPDTVIQRLIEFLMAIPTLPLWLALSAAVPSGWGPLMRYFAITVILSVIGWTGMARVVRGRFLSLREEDFVTAARLDGCSRPRIIFRHMVPSFSSHIIASLTMAVPAMILGETALSFLGLGLQSPAVSWGVLLQDAQNVRAIQTAPWLMLPGAAIFVTVLAMNFVGDGIRDAADPYK